jgi:hypothetical protein
MSNPLRPIADQFSLWFKTVFSQETATTYNKTFQVTVSILKETGKLLWLVLCFGLVLFQWVVDSSQQLWQESKTWYGSIEEPKGEHLWEALSKVVSETSRSSVAVALGQAREQLGLPIAAEAKAAPMPAAPKPPAVNASTPPAATTAATTAAAPAEEE